MKRVKHMAQTDEEWAKFEAAPVGAVIHDSSFGRISIAEHRPVWSSDTVCVAYAVWDHTRAYVGTFAVLERATDTLLMQCGVFDPGTFVELYREVLL